MTRVSLKEAYDNKDVVAQIYAIRDIDEGAGDTANNAVTTANTASAHVDKLVPQVEGAVTNANNASASAQASAQTVAGYENRVTALETADEQNVKLSGNQNIGGIKTVPTEATGTRSQQIANSEKVGAELDEYAPMVRTTGNQEIAGIKSIKGTLLDRCAYCKNTTGVVGPIPLFKLPTETKNDGYLKTALLLTGRTTATSITEVVWNNTLTKTDVVGTQPNPFSIMSDTNGDYWLCIQTTPNNSISAFQICAFRNAGFDARLQPISSSETPNMTGWSVVVSQ